LTLPFLTNESINVENITKFSKNCTKPLNERCQPPGLLTSGVRLLHDGARPHTSAQAMAWLQRRKWEVLELPPHIPHLASTSSGHFRTFDWGKDFKPTAYS
jgi:hypothetical protein